MRIAFLGLGHMGLPMAQNLLGPEHTVTVYNRTPGRAEALIALGAKEARSVAEAVANAEVAITMLSDDAAVKAVVQGPAGLLKHLPPKGIHLCMGTLEVETSTALAAAHAQAKQGYVAAPVFGRVDTAESRHIWIVAGGPEPQVNRCRPIFDALGRGYTRVGSNAALAHALKLGGNMLTMAMELAVSELLIYAQKAGLPPADYLRFLNTAVFRSHMVDNYRGGAARPSFDPEDRTLDLAANEQLLQKASDMGVAIPVADLLNARLQAAGARGWGEQDLAELSQACRQETGLDRAPDPELADPSPSLAHPEAATPAPPKAQVVAPPEPASAQPVETPRPIPPVLVRDTGPRPTPAPTAETHGSTLPKRAASINRFTALDGEAQVTLDLDQTSHFEAIKGQVWAWSRGQRYGTLWRTLGEVEMAFNHVLFLLIQRHVLLRPEAVLALRPTFGGGAKARVDEDLELSVSRAAAPRLKVLLGI